VSLSWVARLKIKSSEQTRIDEAAWRLAAIVESSDDAIVSKDLNGIVTSWNKAAERIFGWTEEEMVGRSILTIIPPELHGEEPGILAKLAAGERIEHFETVRMNKNGDRLDISLTVSPMKDRNGDIVGGAKIARDITQQKKAEQAALRLAAIVESSDDAIISKDLKGIVTSWNRAAERIFGWTEEEMIGRSILTIIPPELHGDEPGILAKIAAGERIEHFETVRMHKNGDRLDISLTVSPMRDRHGKIVGGAKIARDITQQKRLEGSLRTTERLASVGRLAATVAHEINNPLEAITNFIYLAKQQPNLSEKLQRYLSNADEELRRVAHIAQQTLGFYRDNSMPTRLVVGDLINDVVTIYERKIAYKGLQLKVEVAPDLTITAMGGELKQILSNLVSNAIDASSNGGKIVLRARRSTNLRSGSSGVRITVADNGVGIAKHHQPQLFVPFFTTKKDVGTGLGLWITRDLVQKKSGTIQLRSSDRRPSGTVISIFLPESEVADAAVERVAAENVA
jgi:PAS domain S-box-containing protein